MIIDGMVKDKNQLENIADIKDKMAVLISDDLRPETWVVEAGYQILSGLF